MEAHLEICLFYSQSKENERKEKRKHKKEQTYCSICAPRLTQKKKKHSTIHFGEKKCHRKNTGKQIYNAVMFIITPKNYVNMTFHFFLFVNLFCLLIFQFLFAIKFLEIFFSQMQITMTDTTNVCFPLVKNANLQMAVLNYLFVNRIAFDDFAIESIFSII